MKTYLWNFLAMKLKNDRYRKVRGGKAKVLSISCAKCGTLILKYQKDGDGSLHRTYLNRIIAPDKFVGLDSVYTQPKEMQNLICEYCSNLIGTPMTHTDGRLAFRLIKGNYSKSVARPD